MADNVLRELLEMYDGEEKKPLPKEKLTEARGKKSKKAGAAPAPAASEPAPAPSKAEEKAIVDAPKQGALLGKDTLQALNKEGLTYRQLEDLLRKLMAESMGRSIRGSDTEKAEAEAAQAKIRAAMELTLKSVGEDRNKWDQPVKAEVIAEGIGALGLNSSIERMMNSIYTWIGVKKEWLVGKLKSMWNFLVKMWEKIVANKKTAIAIATVTVVGIGAAIILYKKYKKKSTQTVMASMEAGCLITESLMEKEASSYDPKQAAADAETREKASAPADKKDHLKWKIGFVIFGIALAVIVSLGALVKAPTTALKVAGIVVGILGVALGVYGLSKLGAIAALKEKFKKKEVPDQPYGDQESCA